MFCYICLVIYLSFKSFKTYIFATSTADTQTVIPINKLSVYISLFRRKKILYLLGRGRSETAQSIPFICNLIRSSDILLKNSWSFHDIWRCIYILRLDTLTVFHSNDGTGLPCPQFKYSSITYKKIYDHIKIQDNFMFIFNNESRLLN